MTRSTRVETDIPGRGFMVKRESSKVSIIYTPHHKQIVVWEGTPIAVYADGTLYRHPSATGVKQAALSKLYAQAAEMTFHTQEFEFVLGQTLSQAGLALVRREE